MLFPSYIIHLQEKSKISAFSLQSGVNGWFITIRAEGNPEAPVRNDYPNPEKTLRTLTGSSRVISTNVGYP